MFSKNAIIAAVTAVRCGSIARERRISRTDNRSEPLLMMADRCKRPSASVKRKSIAEGLGGLDDLQRRVLVGRFNRIITNPAVTRLDHLATSRSPGFAFQRAVKRLRRERCEAKSAFRTMRWAQCRQIGTTHHLWKCPEQTIFGPTLEWKPMAFKSPPTQIVGYDRVSTEGQGVRGLGRAAQREAVERYARSHGLTITAVYKEVETGRKQDLANRPQLVAAVGHAGRCGATLVIARLDRLARSVFVTAQLMNSGVEFVVCDNPHANSLSIHILAAMAEYEGRLIA